MNVVKPPVVEVRLYNEGTVLLANMETSPSKKEIGPRITKKLEIPVIVQN